MIPRQHIMDCVTITPVAVRFVGAKGIPDGTPGLVVGISMDIENCVAVRAEYPNWGHDVWAISIDNIEEVRAANS